MKQKKVPMRMCVGCREMKPKRELIRIVRTPEGAVALDRSGKASGRGAYVCADPACLDKAVKIRAFDRAFEQKVEQPVFEKVREELSRIANHVG